MGIANIVEEELNRAREKYGDQAPLMYLNSFILRLPDKRFNRRGYLRQYFDEASWRTKHKDLPNPNLGFSEIFKNQTPEEFYTAVDRTIKECGISIEDIYRLQRTDKLALCNLAWPIFIRLREMGYQKIPCFTPH